MKQSLAIVAALLAPFALQPSASFAAEPLVISAAASLKGAFEEIGANYASPAGGPRPAFNFGASGDLTAQIRAGAPVDVFAAAAAKDMDGLENAGALLPGTRIDFASNEIVLIAPRASTAGVSSFADLAQPAVVRIAIGNPKTSPAGRYAEEVFAATGIATAVRSKLVLAENVRQLLDYVARGEVDAGVVYATDAALRPREVRVGAVAPAGSHRPAIYPIAVVNGTRHPGAAMAFLSVVRSDAGQAILAEYGFTALPAAR